MRPNLILLCFFVLFTGTCVRAQTHLRADQYKTLKDLLYRPDTQDFVTSPEDVQEQTYAAERCKLDLYYPTDSTGFATIIFFHGGGLEFGGKYFPEEWKNQGVAIVAANYRLHPKVKNPVYTQDAAAAVAWTMQNIDKYGGDPSRIYVSGHSAGGYLTSMIGMDTTYLAAFGEHPDSLAGLIPFSGHTITHFTPRKERGLAWNNVVVDEYAPIHHLRISALPMALITGDREMELFGRYEENAYFWRMLVASGHKTAFLYELDGFGHGPMVRPAAQLALELIRKWERE